jgi:SAM-dependent methyltransferase
MIEVLVLGDEAFVSALSAGGQNVRRGTATARDEDGQMSKQVDLYDSHYGRLDADPQVAVRRQTYDEDLGQASWITLAEARELFRALELCPGDTALEVACGSGGITCRMALETGARCVGIDINVPAIDAAARRAQELGLASRVTFQVADAASQLPFPDESFDAIFCNDSINHFPGRREVLRDWHRLLRPGGRLLYTDPIVVTGQLTNEEIRVRSSIGFFLFTPVACNERLLAESGFALMEVRDLTEAVASVSKRWRDAREERRAALVKLEGDEGFEGLQRFLAAVHSLASERRLSRYMYLASKQSGSTPHRALHRSRSGDPSR